jgi:hypothetical protein
MYMQNDDIKIIEHALFKVARVVYIQNSKNKQKASLG